MDKAIWWLLLNLFSIICLGFYSMIEMACVSFNKVRLHYYVSQGNRRAKWINDLLQHPFRLFGTTLIGVNVAMVVGSEFSREFYRSIGLSPDIAPLTQVALVIIFGELAPMFAARHFAENVAMRGAPFLYASSKLLSPVLWLIGVITKLTNLVVQGKTSNGNIFLSQEELQAILEEHGEESVVSQEFNTISRNIFMLRHKNAQQCLTPLQQYPVLPSNATVSDMKKVLEKNDLDFVPVYSFDAKNIVGIALPRDLIRAPANKRVRDFTRPPWFVTENTPLTHILQQFQRNNQSVAVILDKQGKATGLISLDDILDELFGEYAFGPLKAKPLFVIDRTFPGTMLVRDFNKQFDVILDKDDYLTLAELMTQTLGRQPEEEESIIIHAFELTAVETSLLEVKSINIKSRLV